LGTISTIKCFVEIIINQNHRKMKKIFFFIALFFLAFSACKKMDSMYRDFVVPGGMSYVGKANSPKAYVGHNRIKISWLRGADPNVIKARIFWNNYIDSVEVNIPPTGDTISVIIDNLPEKSYSFIIKTYNSEGLSSVPIELIKPVYGARYQASLLNRPIKSSIMDAQGIVTLQWGTADIANGAYATEVTYTDNGGVTKMLYYAANMSSSIISDYKAGTTFQFRTVFLPDSSSIDTFYTNYVVQPISKKISKSTWTATASSFSAPYIPSNAIDDNIATFWNSDYNVKKPPFPHWLMVDMKKSITVTSVDLTPRQGFKQGFYFRIEGSNDGTNWINYGSYLFTLDTNTQSFALIGTPTIRYLRIYQTIAYDVPTVIASCFGELTAYGL